MTNPSSLAAPAFAASLVREVPVLGLVGGRVCACPGAAAAANPNSRHEIKAGFMRSATRLIEVKRAGSFYTKRVELSTSAIALTTVALVTFGPVLRNEFLNWDDPAVLLDNPHLGLPGAMGWAFSTTYMGHYQPLAWLTWSLLAGIVGLCSPAFHALSLAGHAVNGMLIWLLTRRFSDRAGLIAAAAFLVHPLTAETVAWASAFPYVLSLTWLLLSVLAYFSERRVLAAVCYAVSLLTRATAIGFPIVLLMIDFSLLDRRRRESVRRIVVEKLPFVALAAVAAFAEWSARDVASIQEIGIGARLTMAAEAPFVYLERLFWPVRLSPLDALPISPAPDVWRLVLSLAALIIVSIGLWMLRRRWPMAGATWAAYVALIAPVAGLTPSGIQATADRYMYVPLVVFAVAAGVGAVVSLRPVSRLRSPVGTIIPAAGLGLLCALGAVTWRQVHYWHDSIALWTRVVDLDPHNDVATYNLGSALAQAGRDDEAMRRYEETLALVPDQALARKNLDLLRTRRASRGMLLMRSGRFREAEAALRAAMDGGVRNTELPNALAFVLLQEGDAAGAAEVLSRAMADFPDDVNLKHNLARILATAPDPRVRDGARAVRLALEVCERIGNSDPRALDTLAAAYAAAGQIDMARATASRALAAARSGGDQELAAQIEAHAKEYR